MQQHTSHFLSTRDFLVSGENFALRYDPEYDMLVTSPRPEPDKLAGYYESDHYISHSDSDKGLLAFLYQTVKRRALKSKLRLIEQLNSGKGSLLDVGAGTGAFLKASAGKGWRIAGVEPNKKARDIAFGKDVSLNESLAELGQDQFDVVSLWHVLEHMPDLHNVVEQLKMLVKPGGHLLIAVPNFKSYDAKFYKEFWAAYDVPRHLWHFSEQSVRMLFSDRLNLVAIKPMIYDSFYVSLLSEKYKNGSAFSLKALLIGFISNMKAWSSGEYSSRIYCFRKPN